MTIDFLSRIIGLVVFAALGARAGADIARFINWGAEEGALLFALVGMLFGLIATPWISLRPLRFIRRMVNEMSVEQLVMSLTGLVLGLSLALLVAYPLSLLSEPFGSVLPAIASVVSGYIWLTIFTLRSREILNAFSERFARGRRLLGVSSHQLLIDTSVLIDGRLVDIVDTGFVGGTLIIPRFVLNELHRVADSSDPLRRNRGRRGLNMVNSLQQNTVVPVKIVDDDFEEIPDVDNKLVALALQMDAVIVTNDYNLNRVAEAQGVMVLNINKLANAVRSIYIPGETFVIRIIQEGKDPDQGVGYLDDGTMVVVEKGKMYMDRSVRVQVTKLISREAGRMIFAIPESEAHKHSEAP